jgi:hypothetical protein
LLMLELEVAAEESEGAENNECPAHQ